LENRLYTAIWTGWWSRDEDVITFTQMKCIGCGVLLHVECSYLDEVAQHVASHHRFAIDHTKTVLYGLCELCAAKQEGVPVCAG